MDQQQDRWRRFKKLVQRALLWRCPLCGQGPMFRTWFQIHSACPNCQASMEREPGFYLGSIYFNYGLTALVVAVAYPLLLFSKTVPEQPLFWASLAFTVIFPVLFFRHARALWTGFDQWVDPRPGEQ